MLLPLLRTHTIEFTGTWLSTNVILGLNRFTAMKRKELWKETLLPFIKKAEMKPLGTFSVEIRYWSRLDPDNVIGVGIKGLIDLLRGQGIITNDDKRYWKGLTIHPDPSMKHNQYCVKIHVHSEPEALPVAKPKTVRKGKKNVST